LGVYNRSRVDAVRSRRTILRILKELERVTILAELVNEVAAVALVVKAN